MYKLLLCCLCVLFSACFGKGKSQNAHNAINNEDKNEVITLPSELKEISGITFITDSIVAAIEDEHGILYFININTKKIIKKYEFSGDGDYEDLERVGNDIYITESNGTIFEIKDFDTNNPKMNKYKTPLKKKNDIESITYNTENKVLLLAVKKHNLDKDDKESEEKNIYQFSLATKKLDEKPFYRIKIKDIENFYKGGPLEEKSKKFLKTLGNENLTEVITPSAMAYHPITGELYILSSINHIVVVLNKEGNFSNIIKFAGVDFRQPEGISFNSKGELFISNEGQKQSGNIIKIK
ncbi:MAG: SdiA-regulated domain-containing protein [Pelobium sp.]